MTSEIPKGSQETQLTGNMEYAHSEAPIQGDAGPYPFNLAQSEYNDDVLKQEVSKKGNGPVQEP